MTSHNPEGDRISDDVTYVPGDSTRDLFGMVSLRDLLRGV